MDKRVKPARQNGGAPVHRCPYLMKKCGMCTATDKPIYVPLYETQEKCCRTEGAFRACALYVRRVEQNSTPPTDGADSGARAEA